MNDPKYLIWDFDGTLAVRSGGWTSALLSVLANQAPQLPVTPEQIRPFLSAGFPWQAPENIHPGLSPDEWWEELLPLFIRAFRGVGVEARTAPDLAQAVRETYLDLSAWQLFADTLPALDALSRRGWTYILLTNHVPELDCILHGLGLDGRFAAIFNSAATGIEKPNQKAFRAVREWTGITATAWMIGDNYTADILGAQEAGLPAILVRHPNPAVKYSCATLEEIENILAS
ncbi:MAG: HAD family hydrolase [Anaerolineaceae bacterium]|nr:HAD family hydrolase [Anaerolineaceae bacterium]